MSSNAEELAAEFEQSGGPDLTTGTGKRTKSERAEHKHASQPGGDTRKVVQTATNENPDKRVTKSLISTACPSTARTSVPFLNLNFYLFVFKYFTTPPPSGRDLTCKFLLDSDNKFLTFCPCLLFLRSFRSISINISMA
uniref:Uncharacterized protein n=1 Tax=Caenorhabditis japonica TaxID=281687 RepID=A0A8R1DV33_CAEJA